MSTLTMPATWRDQPICGFDTETTSADPETARIVTACLGVASAEHGWKPTNWLLEQAEPIPAEAISVHGITTEYANAHGMNARDGIGLIKESLYGVWGSGWPVAGHNIVYDLTVLDRECRRHGLGGLEIRGAVIDTLVVDKAVDRYRKGKRTLTTMAQHYGIVLSEEDAHGAEPDALAAARLAWKMAVRVPSGDLTAWQAKAYAEQRRSFAAYRERRGEPLDDVSVDWPIRPYRGNP